MEEEDLVNQYDIIYGNHSQKGERRGTSRLCAFVNGQENVNNATLFFFLSFSSIRNTLLVIRPRLFKEQQTLGI